MNARSTALTLTEERAAQTLDKLMAVLFCNQHQPMDERTLAICKRIQQRWTGREEDHDVRAG